MSIIVQRLLAILSLAAVGAPALRIGEGAEVLRDPWTLRGKLHKLDKPQILEHSKLQYFMTFDGCLKVHKLKYVENTALDGRVSHPWLSGLC